MRQLEALVVDGRRHIDVCEDAYLFRYEGRFAELRRRMQADAGDIWIRIRHFVGRLGHWHKTAACLIGLAPKFGFVFRDYGVRLIPQPYHDTRHILRLDEDLRELAFRVFPNFRGSPLGAELVEKIKEAGELIDWFRTNTLKPRPHAEAVILDFFFTRNLQFANDDRYIACSKPSCYCCTLYFKYHPGGFRPRPSHGNTWVQWCQPQSIDMPLETETSLSILRRMVNEITACTQASLTNKIPHKGRRFDSTTGVSSSGMAF